MDDRNSTSNAKSLWTKHVDKELESLEDKKVDDKVCKEKHGNVEKLATEAKALALIAKKRADQPHSCIKEDILEDLNGWKKWLRAGIFSLSGVVILGIAAWYAQRSDIDRSLIKQEENIKQIGISVEAMEESQKGILVKFKLQKEEDKKNKKEEIKVIKEAITGAIREANREERRKPRGRKSP